MAACYQPMYGFSPVSAVIGENSLYNEFTPICLANNSTRIQETGRDWFLH
jgi:hypothetical protein